MAGPPSRLRRLGSVFSPWVRYTALRLGMFLGLFLLFFVLGIVWWLAAILAAVISLCLSYIFLADLRNAVATDIATRRAAPDPRGADENAEDAAVDGDGAGLEGERGGETQSEQERREGGQP
jgi:Protein of unknown function (DUF4229)